MKHIESKSVTKMDDNSVVLFLVLLSVNKAVLIILLLISINGDLISI